jgi:hypothetical protein
VNLPNSEVEGVRVGLFRVVRPIGDVEHVEDRVCTFASEPDWLGAGADEDEFDLVGDLTRSLDTFITQLPGRFPAQILPGQRCCRLVERVKLARDLEDDIHASEAIRSPRLRVHRRGDKSGVNNNQGDAMSRQDPGLTPIPDEQEPTPGEEPGMTPPATAPEPGTLPEEPDVEAPEHGNDVKAPGEAPS